MGGGGNWQDVIGRGGMSPTKEKLITLGLNRAWAGRSLSKKLGFSYDRNGHMKMVIPGMDLHAFLFYRKLPLNKYSFKDQGQASSEFPHFNSNSKGQSCQINRQGQ